MAAFVFKLVKLISVLLLSGNENEKPPDKLKPSQTISNEGH
jgi:hypothetical protein